ncbi:MAG: hypothetical protein ACI4JN_06070, partial [Ruminococcus sp.]
MNTDIMYDNQINIFGNKDVGFIPHVLVAFLFKTGIFPAEKLPDINNKNQEEKNNEEKNETVISST